VTEQLKAVTSHIFGNFLVENIFVM